MEWLVIGTGHGLLAGVSHFGIQPELFTRGTRSSRRRHADREGLATQQGGHSTGWFDDSIIIDPLRALRDSVVKLGFYGMTGSTMCDGICALQ